jgi:hypothetical protein
MPDFEFWFAGYALISAAGFLFALVLGAIGAGPVLTKLQHRRIVWSGVAIIAALTWWQLAKKEEENAKPDRDYVYFTPSNDPRDNNGEAMVLIGVASGPLRDVAFAIQKGEERKKGTRTYISYGRIPIISEGGTLLPLALPIGDYWIDLDPPTKLGKVLEHIVIKKTDGNPITEIYAFRKATSEVVYPPQPPIIPTSGKIVLSLIFLVFIGFGSILWWASWRTA